MIFRFLLYKVLILELQIFRRSHCVYSRVQLLIPIFFIFYKQNWYLFRNTDKLLIFSDKFEHFQVLFSADFQQTNISYFQVNYEQFRIQLIKIDFQRKIMRSYWKAYNLCFTRRPERH